MAGNRKIEGKKFTAHRSGAEDFSKKEGIKGAALTEKERALSAQPGVTPAEHTWRYFDSSSRRTMAAPALNALSLPLATRRESGVMPQLVEG